MYMNLVVTILAGGLGKRMKSDLPKVLHLFKEKPMLVHIIEQSLTLKPCKIIIITGKFNTIIQETLRNFFDEKQFSQFIFVIQETPLGTGHAVSCCLSNYTKNEDVLILNGDTPKLNQTLLEKFIYSSKDNLLMTCELDNPYGYGRIIKNKDNQIEKIVEEKDASQEEREIKNVNSGIYKIKGEHLINYIPLIQNNNKQNEYYLTDIIEILLNKNESIFNYTISKEENNLILGVNTKEQLEDLEKL